MKNNRKQIEKFCNDRNIKIHSSIYLTDSNISTYDTTLGDNITDGIKIMFDNIVDDIDEVSNRG